MLCTLLFGQLAAADLRPVRLQLDYYHQFQFAGFYAADIKGYYRDEGLQVSIEEYRPGLDAMAAVLANQADFAVSGKVPFIEWQDGRDLFLVAVLFQRSPFSLIVHADSPYVTIQDIIDLPKERMAGTLCSTQTELWLGLKQCGVDPTTFFTRTRQQDDLERFAKGELSLIAGYSTNEGQRLHRMGIETRALRLLPRPKAFPGDVLLCRGQLYRQDSALVDGFRRASLLGWAYALVHQDEIIEHILADRPTKGQENTRTHLLDEAAATYDAIDPDRFPIGDISIDRLQRIAALLGDAGLPGQVPTGLIYQTPTNDDRLMAWLAVGMIAGTLALIAFALVSRRHSRSLSESKAHYQNLVNAADGYVAFRMRMLPGDRPFLDMASRSIVDIFGHQLTYYQEDIDHLFAQIHAEDRGRLESELRKSSESLQPLRCRFRLRHPRHEHYRHLMMHATPTRTERGLFFDGILLDLSAEAQAESDRQNLQQQLQLAQRHESLGLLASGVAHDFNNILSAIRGNAELIAPLMPATGKHRLDRLFQAVDRASGLVRQILAYAGRGTIESRPLNLEEEITQIDALVKHALPDNVSTVVKILQTIPAVMFDPAQFQQVAVNLIVNAAESYQGSPGVVTITIGCDSEVVLLRVSDQGCGMDQSTIARIFEPYYTTKENGHGIGLAAVQGIIQGVGGTISCESQPGHGTTFTIALTPCRTASTSVTEHVKADSQVIGNQFILVADDDELVREITVETLSSLGYSCKQASGGVHCQAILDQERDSLCALVVDCRMPDRDGLTILQALREKGDRLPVVLVSGMINADNISRDLLDRRTRFLAKPFSQHQLSAVLDALFGSQRGRRHNHDDSSYTAIMVTDIIRQRQQEENRRSLEQG